MLTSLGMGCGANPAAAWVRPMTRGAYASAAGTDRTEPTESRPPGRDATPPSVLVYIIESPSL